MEQHKYLIRQNRNNSRWLVISKATKWFLARISDDFYVLIWQEEREAKLQIIRLNISYFDDLE